MSQEVTTEAVEKVLFEAIDTVNLTLPTDQKLDKSPDTSLDMSEGAIGSLDLVTLLVEIERLYRKQFNQALQLGDDILTEPENPLQNIRALTNYIVAKKTNPSTKL